MGAVFISYRREDTAGEARALFNDLAARIGKDLVFMDVDNIALGRDFREVLWENLASCDLMLVLIGKGWVDAKDPSGRRRLDDASDFIRLEIGTALKRNIPVTPVLLQGSHMPAAEQLPQDLKELSFRNGFELSHNRWESDVQEMIKRLALDERPNVAARGRFGAVLAAQEGNALREKRTKTLVRGGWALAVAIAVTGGGLLYYHLSPKTNPTVKSPAGSPAGPEQTAERASAPSTPVIGPNDSIGRAKLLVEGTTVRGSRIGDQDIYFFKFVASSAKTRVILRKLSATGFRGIVDVYDHGENRVAGEVEAVSLLSPQDQPVSFSFQSSRGESYYVKVAITQPAAEYELTVREE